MGQLLTCLISKAGNKGVVKVMWNATVLHACHTLNFKFLAGNVPFVFGLDLYLRDRLRCERRIRGSDGLNQRIRGPWPA